MRKRLLIQREKLRGLATVVGVGGSPNASENTDCAPGSSKAPYACPSDHCPTVGPCDISFGPCG